MYIFVNVILLKSAINDLQQQKQIFSPLFLKKRMEVTERPISSIYKFSLSVCLFVSNKRQTDRARIFCGTSLDSREGLWMVKFSKICLHQNSIFESFKNPRSFFFIKFAKFFVFVLLTRRTLRLFINKENPHVYK